MILQKEQARVVDSCERGRGGAVLLSGDKARAGKMIGLCFWFWGQIIFSDQKKLFEKYETGNDRGIFSNFFAKNVILRKTQKTKKQERVVRREACVLLVLEG